MKRFYKALPYVTAGSMLLALAAYSAFSAPAQNKHANPGSYDNIEWEGWGDWNGVITGRVIDKYGKPIPYATVQVHSKDIRINADRNGFFTIQGLQQGGHYSLIITAKGREPDVARWIPIPRFQSANIGDFSLDVEKIWTNFWIVSSNQVSEGTWEMISNFYNVAASVTTVYTVAEWQMRFSTNQWMLQYRALTQPDEMLIDEQPDAGATQPGTGSITNTTGTTPAEQPDTDGGT
jgi:hypothetical protein